MLDPDTKDPTCRSHDGQNLSNRYHLLIDLLLCLCILALILFNRNVLGNCKSFTPIIVLKAIESAAKFHHFGDYPYYCYISVPWLTIITWKLTVLLETATHPLITFVIINQRYGTTTFRTVFLVFISTCSFFALHCLIRIGGWYDLGFTIVNLLGCANLFWASISIANSARLNEMNNCMVLIWIYLITFVPIDTIVHLVISFISYGHEFHSIAIRTLMYIDEVAFWLSGSVALVYLCVLLKIQKTPIVNIENSIDLVNI